MSLIRFGNPGYLLFLLAAIPLFLYPFLKKGMNAHPGKLSFALRLTTAVLLLLALSGLQIARGQRNAAIVFVVDQSQSVAPVDRSGALEHIRRVQSSLAPEDETGVVVFGREAVIEHQLQRNLRISEIQSSPEAAGTDISKGLSLARAMLNTRPEFSKRIMVLSDGNQTTGDALREAAICASERIVVDVRLIVATNKDLEKAIREGTFRQDIYYRLKVVSLHLPPLRERKEDIAELVRYFLQRFRPDINREMRDISPRALEKLMRYHWPGNVRELENDVKRAMVIAKGSTLLPEDFLLEGVEAEMGRAEHLDLDERLQKLMDPVFKELVELARRSPGSDLMSEVEKIVIKRALQETKGNQVQAAILLGISRNTLRSKIERYRIKKDVAITEGEE